MRLVAVLGAALAALAQRATFIASARERLRKAVHEAGNPYDYLTGRDLDGYIPLRNGTRRVNGWKAPGSKACRCGRTISANKHRCLACATAAG